MRVDYKQHPLIMRPMRGLTQAENEGTLEPILLELVKWCEELTLLAERDVPDELYDEVRRVFSEDELCQLTLAVVVINSWNRLAVAFRASVGDYVPRARAAPGNQ